MMYPGAETVGQGNGTGDAKKRLIEMMTKQKAALPLYGGHGRSANDLQEVGRPAINFNPFLKMLANRPGETFGTLPQGISGSLAAGIQNGPNPIQGGGAQGDPGFMGSSVPTSGATNPAAIAGVGASPGMGDPTGFSNVDARDYSTGFGHYNYEGSQSPGYNTDRSVAIPGAAAAPQNPAGGFSSLDPATQLFLLHLNGGLAGYNSDR